jgi:hypothetical protein
MKLNNKIKGEPILITEDGKELFEGDLCVEVYNFEIYSSLKISNKGMIKGMIDYDSKYFSTIELAKKWIEENKPKWNDNDIIEFGSICANSWIEDIESYFNEWKREKLNDN